MEMPLAFDLVLRNFFIEVCMGSRHVGSHPKRSNAETENTDDDPADEAEVKKEKSHFIAIHHFAAFVNALLPCVCGIVVLDVESHGIAVCFDDSGNHEQQGPKKSKQCDQKSKNDIAANIGSKSVERILDFDRIVTSCKG